MFAGLLSNSFVWKRAQTATVNNGNAGTPSPGVVFTPPDYCALSLSCSLCSNRIRRTNFVIALIARIKQHSTYPTRILAEQCNVTLNGAS